MKRLRIFRIAPVAGILVLCAKLALGAESLSVLDSVERALTHYPTVAASIANRDAEAESPHRTLARDR